MPTILLVDDDAMVLTVLERMVQRPGRKILKASTPEQALALAEGEPVDVALVDKNLRGASGLELIPALRRIREDLEAILMTAYVSTESAIQAIQAGAFDYVPKPIQDLESLNLKIQSASEKAALKQQQRQLLTQLQQSEERYRRVFEHARDGMVLATEEGQVVQVNGAAGVLYGLAPEAMVGKPLESLASQDASGLTRQDGTRVDVEVRASAVALEGRPHVLSIIRDVTARNRLEAQLRAGQKLELLGKLAGGVAHDFNNLLAVILGTARAMQPDLAAEDRTDLQAVIDAAERAAQLTRKILHFGRKKGGSDAGVPAAKVVADLQTLLERTLPKAIRLELAVDPASPWVQLDDDQLTQLVLNLVVNARDAMPRGGSIRVSVAPVELVAPPPGLLRGELEPGRYARIRVADTGTGIPKAVLAEMFDPFFTTKPEGVGTGLGLATVDTLIRDIQGGIAVESAPGAGTCFDLYLPAAPALREEGPGHGARRVLIAEDDDAIRALLRVSLRDAGLLILEAANGLDAVNLAKGQAGIDLLVTDVMMPGMNGKKLAATLRAAHPELPVLFISGEPAGMAMLDTADGRGDAYLQKPFSPVGLVRRVKQMLGARPASSAPLGQAK